MSFLGFPSLWSAFSFLYLGEGANHPFRSGQQASKKGTAEVSQARISGAKDGGVRRIREWIEEEGSRLRK